MLMLKQIAETLPEIDEPDFLKWLEGNLAEIDEPDFLKWLEGNLAEKEELIKRNYDGIYIN